MTHPGKHFKKIRAAMGRADEREQLQELTEWMTQAVAPYLVIRHLVATFHRADLPKGFPQKQAEIFVAEQAKILRLRCCLVWSKRLSIHFAADGKIESGDTAKPRQIKP